MSVLCELMPLALPSLASCLQTLIQGHFGPQVQAAVTGALDISSVEMDTLDR